MNTAFPGETHTHTVNVKLPGCRSQHQFHNPPESTASGPLGSTGRTVERWAGRTRNQPDKRKAEFTSPPSCYNKNVIKL